MAAGSTVQRGRLHAALQAVLAARVTYDRQADAVLAEAVENAVGLAKVLGNHGMSSVVNDIGTLVQQLRASLPPILNDGAAAMDRHAHGLLQALASVHGRQPIPEFAPGPRNAVGNATDGTRFDGNFASSYATSILSDVNQRLTMPFEDVAAIQPMTQQRIDDAAEEILQHMPDRCRKRARVLLSTRGCHAVGFHGPQLTTEELVARCVWARPLDHGMTRREKWAIRPGDTVHTLPAGATPAAPVSGQFTSPEAFAKALTAFFDAADRYHNANDNQGGMTKMLSDKAIDGRATITSITLADAGLRRGDVVSYKPAGARGAAAREDWTLARARAMAEPSARYPSLPVRKVEPTLEHRNPRLTFVFQETNTRGSGQWVLVTMFA